MTPPQYFDCAICGLRKAETKDHVVPRGIFATPRPDDMISVPSCFRCNNKASKVYEGFLVYLSLHVGVETLETKALWNQALRTLTYNKKLTKKILKDSKWVYVKSPGGIIYDRRVMGLWDSSIHDTVAERMVRGLYYHHFNEVLADRVRCSVQWLRTLNEDLYKKFEEWPGGSIGAERFVYRYGRASEKSLYSTWLFQFYGRHWASGYTVPVVDEEREHPLGSA